MSVTRTALFALLTDFGDVGEEEGKPKARSRPWLNFGRKSMSLEA